MTTQRDRTAAAVRAAMAARACTQATIAVALGTTPRSVARRLTGEVPFDVDELATVADVLHVDITALVAA